MSKYFMDCEFLEGTQKENFPISLFKKNTPPTIDLISIGLVAEDRREYYVISKDFNLKEAWNRFQVEEQTPFEKQHGFEGRKTYWIRENVLKPIWIELLSKFNEESKNSLAKGKSYIGCIPNQTFQYSTLKFLIERYGKTNKEIAKEVEHFCNPKLFLHNTAEPELEFYAYYADYDWVAFCWLFGKMMDLPTGFPMYCIDLKQRFDEVQDRWRNMSNEYRLEVSRALNLYSVEIDIKDLSNYPKQENEHNALADARWNKKLFEFLNNL